MTTGSQFIEALTSQLRTGLPTVEVKKNEAVPNQIPEGGLIVVRDGNPGAPEEFLGGFRDVWYTHAAEIEIYVEHGDAVQRDDAFVDLLMAVGAALESDLTFGGTISEGACSFGAPEPLTEPVEGGADIKSAVIILSADYQSSAPIA